VIHISLKKYVCGGKGEMRRAGNLLSLYLSVKRSHHVRRESLEIPTLIKKRRIYTVGFYEDLKV
jgi:hypothetical protein